MGERQHADVIVIGGGIQGCSIAYQLSKRRVSTLVFESSTIAQEASRASAGILGAMMETSAPGPLVELCIASQRIYAGLAEMLRDETGIDIEYNASGLIGVARDEQEKQELRSKWEWANTFGQRVEWLEPNDLPRTEPLLSDRLLCGLFIPNDHQVNSYKVAQAFYLGAKARGAVFFEQTPVFRLLTRDDEVIGVETAAGAFTADKVVLAAGSWSAALLAPLGVRLPVYPVKGQCIAVRLPVPLKKSVFAQKCYLIPKRDGTVTVGATQEEAGFDKETRVEAIQSLFEMAQTMVPAMKDAVFVNTWAGLRPGNPNLKPFLGPLRQWRNLVLATGHFRKGTLLAPITGEIVASILTGGEAPVDWTPFQYDSHDQV